jgi:hypothetical protein
MGAGKRTKLGQGEVVVQPSLFDDPEQAAEVLTRRQLLIEQVKRDMNTLCLSDDEIAPDRQFYEDRIDMLRRELQ